MSLIIFFSSFVLMVLMVLVRSLEMRLGRSLLLSRIGTHADGMVLSRARHAKHAVLSLSQQALMHGFRVSAHGAGMFYGFLRSKFHKAKLDFSEALREKRAVSRQSVSASDFLKDVIAHKTSLREGR